MKRVYFTRQCYECSSPFRVLSGSTESLCQNCLYKDGEPTICPECKNKSVAPNGFSGVKCTTPGCNYWFCY